MIKVLIAGADASDPRLGGGGLEGIGCEVRCSQDEGETRALLEQGDVAVLVVMARRGGLSLLKALPQIAPGVLPIYVIHEGGIRDYQTAVRLGAVDVLVEPFSGEELVEAMVRAVDCLSSFRGNLHGFSLVDMIQLFHLSKRSTVIEVQGKDGAGLVVLQRGEILHAEAEGLEGEDALLLLFAMEAGAVRSLPFREVARSLFAPFQETLFEVLRRLDEGDIPQEVSSRRRIAVRPRIPSRLPTSALPPGDPRLQVLKERCRELDGELGLGLMSGDRCYPLLGGNLGEAELMGVGSRLLISLQEVPMMWRELHCLSRQGGACLLGGGLVGFTLLLARRWETSAGGHYFRRNVAKIQRILREELRLIEPGQIEHALG